MINENDFTANPAPLGLMGFGMTTVLLNTDKLGDVSTLADPSVVEQLVEEHSKLA